MAFGRPEYAENNALLNRMLGEKRALIAAHRGSWGGNITQNTIGAYRTAIRSGADMVESDVNASADGVLFSFHDGNEPRVFGTDKNIRLMTAQEIAAQRPINAYNQHTSVKINTLAEVLDFLPEDRLLNIDRAWRDFPLVLQELDRHPNARTHVVLKAPLRRRHAPLVYDPELMKAVQAIADHPVKYMFMPICFSMRDVEKALSIGGLNIPGCELITSSREDELFSDENIARLHGMGLYVFVNAEVLGDREKHALYGGLDDDVSILEDPALGWGRLFEKKIDIIQTDWPAILRDYRREALGV